MSELDRQINDLNEALHKLQIAIQKIDNESRSKFESSFKAVNEKISEIFPTLFGGGKAELRLLEGDALSSGVALMATPPEVLPLEQRHSKEHHLLKVLAQLYHLQRV